MHIVSDNDMAEWERNYPTGKWFTTKVFPRKVDGVLYTELSVFSDSAEHAAEYARNNGFIPVPTGQGVN